MPALGFIETRGRIGAVEAADAALKTAEVSLITIRRVSGGLMTVILEGEVAAVKVAVEAAKIRARQLNYSVTTNVIPGPAEEIRDWILSITTKRTGKTGKRKSRARSTSKAGKKTRTSEKKAP